MKSPIRIAAAAVAALTVGLTVGGVAPAVAAGHEGAVALGTHARVPVSGKKQVLFLIKVADNTLVRISQSDRVTDLTQQHQSLVLGNVNADRAALAKMKKRVKKAHRPTTVTRVQKRIARFQVENYTDIAYLLSDSEDLLITVVIIRQNLGADESFTPQERADLNARLDAVEARAKELAASSGGLTARSEGGEISNLQDAVSEAETDLDLIDDTVYNGGDTG